MRSGFREADQRSHEHLINFEEEIETAAASEERRPEIKNETSTVRSRTRTLVRSYNCLKNANIQSIGELVQKTKPKC